MALLLSNDDACIQFSRRLSYAYQRRANFQVNMFRETSFHTALVGIPERASRDIYFAALPLASFSESSLMTSLTND